MKSRDKNELHTKTENELVKLISDARLKLSELKLEMAQNKLKNTSDLSNTRREIAVLQSILKEKELIKKNG